MAKAYTIREDTSSSKYRPFQIIDPEDGQALRDQFASREEAEQRIVELNQPMDEDLFDWWIDENEKFETGQKVAEPTPEPKEETSFVGEQHQQGDEITDSYGNVYVATQASYYVSIEESADLEDGWDATVDVGWHTPAKLVR